MKLEKDKCRNVVSRMTERLCQIVPDCARFHLKANVATDEGSDLNEM